MQSGMRGPAGFPHLALPRVLIVAGREPASHCSLSPGRTSSLVDHARRVVQRSGAMADVLDLGWLAPANDPAFALSVQVRERWNAAHGVLVFVPERWDTSESPLRFLIDRLGQEEAPAHAISYGVIVHREGRAEADDSALGAHLESLGLVPARDPVDPATAESYPGYYEPGHGVVSTDRTLHERVRKVAHAVVDAAKKLRYVVRGPLSPAILAA